MNLYINGENLSAHGFNVVGIDYNIPQAVVKKVTVPGRGEVDLTGAVGVTYMDGMTTLEIEWFDSPRNSVPGSPIDTTDWKKAMAYMQEINGKVCDVSWDWLQVSERVVVDVKAVSPLYCIFSLEVKGGI